MISEYKVVPVIHQLAKEWVLKKHYSRSTGIIWETFGLIDQESNLCGIICYGQPSAPISKYAFKEKDFRVYELTRLVIQTKEKNAASFLISNSLKMLKSKPCAIVSYADSAHGHCGIVYQSTNWLYTGPTVSHDSLYVVNGQLLHPMTVRDRFNVTSLKDWAKENNIERVSPKQKHRYFYFVGNKKEKKTMISKLNYKIESVYPKSDKTMYDDGPSLNQKICVQAEMEWV
jgi:hypothetical protein